MLRNVPSHQEHQSFVKEFLSVHYLARGQLSALSLYKNVFAKWWLTDLSPSMQHFSGFYSPLDRSARDPGFVLLVNHFLDASHVKPGP